MAWFEHGTTKIYFEESGSGYPVLLLPGWGGRIENISGIRQALAGSFRVIAADLPGSGRSLPQPRTYTASYFEEDAESFAALLEHLGTGPAHLVGFSDGGEYALLMAVLTPEVARSVVTWGAAGKLEDPGGHLRAAMYNVVDNPIPPMQPFSQYMIATYGEANARAMSQSEAGALGERIETRGGDISMSRAGEIACPVLLITGDHDPFVSPALLVELASGIRVAETIVAKDAGHDVHNSHAVWFEQTVLDWLS